VWSGDVLNPGANETLTALHRSGRALAFVSNNSRATGRDLRERLHRLGVVVAEHVLTPLEIIGEVIRERCGPSRVLAIGAPEMGAVIARAGHELLDVKNYRDATVVAVGNDFDLSYERLTAAAGGGGGGGGVGEKKIDPKLPIEREEFLPGCGSLVQAVAVAAGVRPIVVGKPEPPLFKMALERLGLTAAVTAMVGDSIPSDIRGAQAVGMPAVLYAPGGGAPADAADVVVASFAELARLAGVG
jgi:4-nitrophenyl phosphatase